MRPSATGPCFFSASPSASFPKPRSAKKITTRWKLEFCSLKALLSFPPNLYWTCFTLRFTVYSFICTPTFRQKVTIILHFKFCGVVIIVLADLLGSLFSPMRFEYNRFS
eukprot:UN19306